MCIRDRSNIGEGKRRKTDRAFRHHLDIALGSQGEVEVQLDIALRLGFATQTHYETIASRAQEVGRMLNGLIESLDRHNWATQADGYQPVRDEPQATDYQHLSLIHISEPTRLLSISYAVFCLKKKKKQ